MSDCCSTQNKKTDKPSQNVLCPKCNEKGKSVKIITLKSLLKPTAMKKYNPSDNYQFCSTSTCPVVYFNESTSFDKKDVTVKVFQKESKDTTPVCYCFGYNKKQLLEDKIKNEKSLIQEEIKNYTKNNQCACEIRNPQGGCCLGNVGLVLKDIQL